MDKSFIYLIDNANRNCDRVFTTRNMIGTKLYGSCYIGTYNDTKFYLGLRFGVFFFLPIIPMNVYIQFKSKDNKDYIFGSVSKKIINDAGYSYKTLLFRSYKQGMFMGVLQCIFTFIVLYIMAVLLRAL